MTISFPPFSPLHPQNMLRVSPANFLPRSFFFRRRPRTRQRRPLERNRGAAVIPPHHLLFCGGRFCDLDSHATAPSEELKRQISNSKQKLACPDKKTTRPAGEWCPYNRRSDEDKRIPNLLDLIRNEEVDRCISCVCCRKRMALLANACDAFKKRIKKAKSKT